MRVVLYVPLLEPGGAEKQVERIAYGLQRCGFEPWVTWSDRWGVVGERLRDAGVPVRQLPLDFESEASALIK